MVVVVEADHLRTSNVELRIHGDVPPLIDICLHGMQMDS